MEGGKIMGGTGREGIGMEGTKFAPLSDKIKAAIKAISPLPIKNAILTHFPADHTAGVANFNKHSVIAIAPANTRIRLLGGTTNGTSRAKTAPLSGAAIPKQTYFGGSMTV